MKYIKLMLDSFASLHVNLSQRLYLPAFALGLPIMIFGYQNCGPGFKVMTGSDELASVGIQTPRLLDSMTGSSEYLSSLTVNVIAPAEIEGRWCISENQAVQPKSTDACIGGLGPNQGWFASMPTSLTISARDGSRRFYFWSEFPEKLPKVDGQTVVLAASVTVDTALPSLDAVTTLPSFSNQRSPSFQFNSADTTSGLDRVECSLNGSPLASCTSPLSLSIATEGPQFLSIKAYDRAGNRTQLDRSWQADFTNPLLNVGSFPAVTANLTGQIAFSPNETTSVTCQTDNGSVTSPCNSPYTWSVTSQGAHTIKIVATDRAGNVTTETKPFTVDSAQPTIQFVSFPPATPVSQLSGNIVFTVNPSGTPYVCTIDGVAVACANQTISYNFPSGDAAHTVTVVATKATGVSATETRTWIVDSVRPNLTISGTTLTGPSGEIGFSVSGETRPVTFQCGVDNTNPTAACTNPFAFSGLAEGSHTLYVRATDAANNQQIQNFTWTVTNTSVPTITIQPLNQNISRRMGTVSFSYTNLGSGTISCFLTPPGGTEAATTCTSNQVSFNFSNDGLARVRIRATKPLVSPVDQTYTWTVDGTNPAVNITQVNPTAVSPVNINFAITETNPSSHTCALNSATVPCSATNASVTPVQGSNTFSVTAVDRAGNTGTDTMTFTYDPTKPTVTFAGGFPPSAPVNTLTGSVSFTTNPATGVSLSCTLDGVAVPAAQCSNRTINYSFPAGSDASHTLRVIATNTSTGVPSDPAIATWIVDGREPTPTISAPTTTGASFSASFTFTGETRSVSTFCAIGLQSAAPIDPTATCTSPFTQNNLTTGNYRLYVKARDAAGNFATATHNFSATVDSTVPTITFDPITNDFSKPTGSLGATITNLGAGTVTCYLTPPGGTASMVSCPLNNGKYIVSWSNLATSGNASVRVKVVKSGIPDTDQTKTWTVDGINPVINITQLPPRSTAAASINFSVTEANEHSRSCTFNGTAVGCATSPISVTANPGNNTFSMTVTDKAGNTTTTPMTFEYDNTDPAINFATGFPPTSPVSTLTGTINFTTDPATGLTLSCTLDGASVPSTQCNSKSINYSFTAGSDTTHTVTVVATKPSGRSDTQTRTWIADDKDPIPTISAPTATGTSFTANFSVSGETRAVSTYCAVGLQSAAAIDPTTACTSPFTQNGLATNNYRFYLKATDAAGNSATVTHNFSATVDNTVPTITFDNFTNNFSTRSGTLGVTITNLGAGTVTCLLTPPGGTEAPVSCPLSGGKYNIAFNFSTDGSASARVRVVKSGLDDTVQSKTWTADGTAPAISIAQVSSPTANATPDVSFSITETYPNTRTCTFNGTPVTCTTSPVRVTASPGNNTFTLTATDMAGNSDTRSMNFDYDATNPIITFMAGFPPGSPVATRSGTVSFSTEPATGVTLSCSLDGAAVPAAQCNAKAITYDFAAGTDATHSVSVTATKPSGRFATETRSWRVDNRGPVLTLTAPASSGFATRNPVNFSFSSNEGLSSVSCVMTGPSGTIGIPCASLSGTAAATNDGLHTVTISGADSLNNASNPISFTFYRDTEGPSFSLAAEPQGWKNVVAQTISFSSGEAGVSFGCAHNQTTSFPPCSSGVQVSSTQGQNHHYVHAYDSLGNASPMKSNSWVLDNSAPSVSANIQRVRRDSAVISGSCSDNGGIGVAYVRACIKTGGCGGGDYTNVACNGGSYSHSVGNLAAGTVQFRAIGVDQLNNSSNAVGGEFEVLCPSIYYPSALQGASDPSGGAWTQDYTNFDSYFHFANPSGNAINYRVTFFQSGERHSVDSTCGAYNKCSFRTDDFGLTGDFAIEIAPKPFGDGSCGKLYGTRITFLNGWNDYNTGTSHGWDASDDENAVSEIGQHWFFPHLGTSHHGPGHQLFTNIIKVVNPNYVTTRLNFKISYFHELSTPAPTDNNWANFSVDVPPRSMYRFNLNNFGPFRSTNGQFAVDLTSDQPIGAEQILYMLKRDPTNLTEISNLGVSTLSSAPQAAPSAEWFFPFGETAMHPRVYFYNAGDVDTEVMGYFFNASGVATSKTFDIPDGGTAMKRRLGAKSFGVVDLQWHPDLAALPPRQIGASIKSVIPGTTNENTAAPLYVSYTVYWPLLQLGFGWTEGTETTGVPQEKRGTQWIVPNGFIHNGGFFQGTTDNSFYHFVDVINSHPSGATANVTAEIRAQDGTLLATPTISMPPWSRSRFDMRLILNPALNQSRNYWVKVVSTNGVPIVVQSVNMNNWDNRFSYEWRSGTSTMGIPYP